MFQVNLINMPFAKPWALSLAQRDTVLMNEFAASARSENPKTARPNLLSFKRSARRATQSTLREPSKCER
jgi:hypothetical protein